MPLLVSEATPLLSVVIPAHNEAEGITPTLRAFASRLRAAGIPFELVVVDDHSTDGTGAVLESLRDELPELHAVTNPRTGGFGHAVLAGLDALVATPGQTVAGGQSVAAMASGANMSLGSDPAELHLELRKAGRPVDPARFFAAMSR